MGFAQVSGGPWHKGTHLYLYIQDICATMGEELSVLTVEERDSWGSAKSQ